MSLVLPWTLYQNNDSDPNETVILGCDCFTVIDLHGCSQMQHRGHQRGGMDAARTLEIIQFEDGKVIPRNHHASRGFQSANTGPLPP